MAAGDRNPRLRAYRFAARDDPLNHLDRHLVDRHTDDGEREDRLAAHRIDVRERVGRGDAAEVVGIVDDGREEIGGGDDRLLVATTDLDRKSTRLNSSHHITSYAVFSLKKKTLPPSSLTL